MKHIYLIAGYGVPKDILTDGNYQTYLRTAFNTIFDDTIRLRITDPIIVLSGGKTDMIKPYRRTEAGEMAKLFRLFMQKDVLRAQTRRWKVLLEPRSISTLENFLSSLGLLKSRKIRSGAVTVFVEKTRVGRIAKFAKIAVPKTFRCNVIGIDFDASANRYLNPKLIAEKEAKILRMDIAALKNEAKLQRHHALYRKRLEYFRKAGSAGHIAAVKKWWEEELGKW